MKLSKEYVEMLEDFHSRCPFCGRHNGRYDRPLEQHSVRCRYKGDASSYDVSVPNYTAYIAQDDVTYLPHVWSKETLRRAMITIEKLEDRLVTKPDDTVP